jgi:abhydrolase domain-containing protein 12
LSNPSQFLTNAVHGNAGHIAQGWRPDTYRNLALQPNTHVVTIDYRGFGHSTGSPTELGLVADGTALANWVLQTAQIPPDRIVILGQSLGTVASAVALNFIDPKNELLPQNNISRSLQPILSRQNAALPMQTPTLFASVILVAPFYSLPSLLLTYRLGGLVPLLAPLRPFPWLGKALTSRMIDQWPTAKRLAAYTRATSASPQFQQLRGLVDYSEGTPREMGVLQIIHAKSDMDISFHQTEMICAEVFGEERVEECVAGEDGMLVDVRDKGRVRARVRIVEHGGKFGLSFFDVLRYGLLVPFADTNFNRSQPLDDLLGCRDCGGEGIRASTKCCISTVTGKTAIWKRNHILFMISRQPKDG